MVSGRYHYMIPRIIYRMCLFPISHASEYITGQRVAYIYGLTPVGLR